MEKNEDIKKNGQNNSNSSDSDDSGKRSWFGRVSNKFSDALQASRGEGRRDEFDAPAQQSPAASTPRRERPAFEESAPPRPQVKPTVQPPPQPQQASMPFPPAGKRMVVPEGVTIGGPVRAANVDTEIAGKIEGDITIDGRLLLGQTAVVTGAVRAASCSVEGVVEGKMECTHEIEVARTGRLNSDAVAGKLITVAGHVQGTLQSPALRLLTNGRVDGDVQTRQLTIEEGAVFNGRCGMMAPAKAAPAKGA